MSIVGILIRCDFCTGILLPVPFVECFLIVAAPNVFWTFSNCLAYVLHIGVGQITAKYDRLCYELFI